MQPRSKPLGCSLRVTNAPDFSSNALGISTVRFARLTTYASRASRAMRTAISPSRSAYAIRLDNKARALTLSARFSDRFRGRLLPLTHCNSDRAIGLATFIGPDLSFTTAYHARPRPRRRNHDAVPGDDSGRRDREGRRGPHARSGDREPRR